MRDVITEHGAIKQLIIENVLDPGHSLQAELDAREMTQRQLATIAGINKSKTNRLITGMDEFTLWQLHELCRALGADEVVIKIRR
jgi:DNA-binding Xre family transcriptional regulator